ncbi:MAG: MucR family transcriptional regulator [Acetobacteraceae bacterium]
MADSTAGTHVLQLTAQIVSAHISHNSVSIEGLPSLIQDVYKALSGAGCAPAAPAVPEPVVPIKTSVFDDYIICLEDGKKMKMLKRHLRTVYAMTPEDYRKRWGLSPDYPMVAPNYAKRRSELAKQSGLGIRPHGSPETEAAA